MIAAERIELAFDGIPVLDGATLAVEAGHTVALLGPSGSGKSTLLRVIAGLETPQAGRVLVDGVDVTDLPAHRRGVGMMFQAPTLFPHRDVGENVAFGLRVAGADRDTSSARVRELLALVGLEGLERRRVGALSGGEAQRVALARALAPAPRALLLDEPLSSLDGPLRERLRDDLARLFDELDVSVVHVTHDVSEAFALGDSVAVMRDGTIAQVGSPDDVWRHPANAGVARLLGMDNVTETGVTRPEAVRARRAAAEGQATVTSTARTGPTVSLVLRLDDGSELTSVTTEVDHPLAGDRVDVEIDRDGVTRFEN